VLRVERQDLLVGAQGSFRIAQPRHAQLGQVDPQLRLLGFGRPPNLLLDQLTDFEEALGLDQQRHQAAVQLGGSAVTLHQLLPELDGALGTFALLGRELRRRKRERVRLFRLFGALGAVEQHLGQAVVVVGLAVQRLEPAQRLVRPGRADQGTPGDNRALRLLDVTVAQPRQAARRGLRRLPLWLELDHQRQGGE
jgi:hypothetical protein